MSLRRRLRGQALADFLATHPILNDSPLVTELLDEEVMVIEEVNPYWEMYFDRASRILALSEGSIIKRKAGVGVVFRTRHNDILYCSYSHRLKEDCSNNEALIIELTLALDMGITHLYAFGDSQLVVRQL